MTVTKRGRGRPVTGNAMTPTERVKVSEAGILADGGQRLGTVRINAEAVKALEALIARYGSKKAAVEAALVGFSKTIVGTNDK